MLGWSQNYYNKRLLVSMPHNFQRFHGRKRWATHARRQTAWLLSKVEGTIVPMISEGKESVVGLTIHSDKTDILQYISRSEELIWPESISKAWVGSRMGVGNGMTEHENCSV